jgi:hypothetical protein
MIADQRRLSNYDIPLEVDTILGRYLATLVYANIFLNHDNGLAIPLRWGGDVDQYIFLDSDRTAKLDAVRFEPGKITGVMDRQVAGSGGKRIG